MLTIVGIVMIIAGIAIALTEAIAKLRAAAQVANINTTSTTLPDLLKAALTAPIANVLVVLGTAVLLADRGILSLTLGEGTGS